MTRVHGLTIACFITPHGFGHASRAAAVMAALGTRLPGVRFELFTTAPQWLFKDTLGTTFGYHPVATDIGLVQLSPLKSDLGATCEALGGLLPFDTKLLDRLASRLRETHSRLVLCDIAAMGIAAARRAGLPSVLVENFTWDWIYQGLVSRSPGLQQHIAYLGELYAGADMRVQTEPLCLPVRNAIKVAPISRRPGMDPAAVRRKLGLPSRARMVLISMGGVPERFAFLDNLPANADLYFVIPGADPWIRTAPNVILLPAHSRFHHPDLIQAADVLIGKAGYSTVAEAYYAGIPFGYVSRSDSPESPALEAFIAGNLPHCAISEQAYAAGGWLDALPRLLGMARNPRKQEENGAAATADHICALLGL